MTHDTTYKVVKLLIIALVAVLFTMAYSILTAYEGRKELVSSQRAACERGKLDRGANAVGWRAAQTARMNTLAKDLKVSLSAVEAMIYQPVRHDDPPDLTAARKYDRISSGLESRSRIECDKAFPKASLIP